MNEPFPRDPAVEACDQAPRPKTRRPARMAGRLVVVAGLLVAPVTVPSMLQHAAAGAQEVNIQGLSFLPGDIAANVGDEIVWTSHDPDTHSINGGPISSPDLHQGESFRFTVTEPGDISYTCRYHQFMRGTIKVAGAGGGTAPPAPGAPAPPAPPAPAPGGGLPDLLGLIQGLLGGLLPHTVPGSVPPAPVPSEPGGPEHGLPVASGPLPGLPDLPIGLPDLPLDLPLATGVPVGAGALEPPVVTGLPGRALLGDSPASPLIGL